MKGKKYLFVFVFLLISVSCFCQKKEIKPKDYGAEILGAQSYNINYLDTIIDLQVFKDFYFEQDIRYPNSELLYRYNNELNNTNFSAFISAVYYADGSIEEYNIPGVQVNSVKLIDSVKLNIIHPYYINIMTYKLSDKNKRILFGNSSIRIEQLIHNYVKFRIKGEFEFWDRIVDIRAIGLNGNYLMKDEEQNQFIDDTTEELERSYKGNIKEFDVLIADSVVNQYLSITIPNRRTEKHKYEVVKINGLDAIMDPYTGEVVYANSPFPLTRIGNYFYSMSEGDTAFLAVLDPTEKKLFKLPSYQVQVAEVKDDKYLLTKDSTNRWGVIDIKGEIVIPFIYSTSDADKFVEQIKLLK